MAVGCISDIPLLIPPMILAPIVGLSDELPIHGRLSSELPHAKPALLLHDTQMELVTGYVTGFLNRA